MRRPLLTMKASERWSSVYAHPRPSGLRAAQGAVTPSGISILRDPVILSGLEHEESPSSRARIPVRIRISMDPL
jgi:hypothetical protein